MNALLEIEAVLFAPSDHVVLQCTPLGVADTSVVIKHHDVS